MIKKPAEVKYPIHHLLRERWSTVAFSERAVEPDKLRSLLEAVRWASSSYNEQPWSFILADKSDKIEYDRLLSCLVEGNVAWARNAPVLLLSVAKFHFNKSGAPNRHAFHDVGLAMGNLVVQASALDLFVHMMAGFHVDKARQIFSIPEGYEPASMAAIGYLGDQESLPENLRNREQSPRTRRKLEEFVFVGTWNNPSPLVID